MFRRVTSTTGGASEGVFPSRAPVRMEGVDDRDRELERIVFRFVRIVGVERAVPIADILSDACTSHLQQSSLAGAGDTPVEASVPVRGCLGRVLDADVPDGRCLVQTLVDGLLFDLPESVLETEELRSAEEGGFDFVWPFDQEGLVDSGFEVGKVLCTRGWCTLQVPRSSDLRSHAVDRAQRSVWAPQKQELVADFLGHCGSGRATTIDPLRLNNEASLSATLLAGPALDPIAAFDADISSIFMALCPIMWSTLGFTSTGRTDAMIWMPLSSAAEKAQAPREVLCEEDIEDGVLDRHLHFLKRRRLCFVYLVHTEGGRLCLYTPDGLKAKRAIEVPAEAGRMLVFRCDRFAFGYEPSGEHVTLVAWALEEPMRMQFSDVVGDPRARDELCGILRGPGAPYHDCARILSIACGTGGDVSSSDHAGLMYTAGCDAGVKVPFTRFDTDLYMCQNGDEDHRPGVNSYHIHGGLCTDEAVMAFDHRFFGIDEDMAAIMSPNQRKVLEVGYEALHGAGFSKASLQGCPIMVYIGDCGTEWANQLLVMRHFGVYADSGKFEPKQTRASKLDWEGAGSLSVVGSRLSYTLSMTGPVSHFDTACSSGLTAFCTAMYSLRVDFLSLTLGSHVRGALAGGVNQIVDPAFYIGNSAQHMLSLKGRCFTFDMGGDGYGRGEGTSMVYTTFGKEERDLELQEGCAIGNKVNQDGRSASMTAPNGPSQQMCIKASLREAQVGPHDITASECHGTGTSLGDPIEVGSLRGVQETDARETALLCTSSKTNIGHLEANAGTTGLIKCILMGRLGTAPPNCHLRVLNPHLDVNGWPAVFEAEMCDFGQNSGLVGVSSFGVSGTNAHAEVWAVCRRGPNAADRFANLGNPEKLDQIRVVCPVTLGPIHYLTGEPVVFPGRGGHACERSRQRADVLRDELAEYDVSSYAYDGTYRYRSGDLSGTGGELDPDTTLFICGSWAGFQLWEEMQLQEDGAYTCRMVLGETLSESFFLCLNKDPLLRIYPVINNAGPRIWIDGPDGEAHGRRWLIDGRDMEVPVGTAYEVRFWWGSDLMRIHWERLSPRLAEAPCFEHKYFVMGSWATWAPQEMLRCLDDDRAWEFSVNIGPSGFEAFQFARDADPQQVLYPSKHSPTDASTPVRGPDDLGAGKHWVIRGRTDDAVSLRLQVGDGEAMLSVISAAGATTFRSRRGWERRGYWVSGSWNAWVCEPLLMDASRPGVFRYRGVLGHRYSEELLGFVECFRVMVDQDPDRSFYPELPYSRSAECIVHGPGKDEQDRMWMLRSWRPDAQFEIALDLHAADRRRVVSWMWSDPSMPASGAGQT